MALGLLIKTTGEIEPTEIPSENGHLVLNELCGGWIDCVRNEDIVGYVNDEGLLIGLEPNILASIIFGRPLVGDCVIVGSLSQDGEYDGENHDIPKEFLSSAFRGIAEVLLANEEVTDRIKNLITNVDLTPKVRSLSEAEFDKWLNGEGY